MVCYLASATAPAPAVASGEWLINGETLVEKGILSETVTGEPDPLNEPELVVPELGLSFYCANVTINGKISRGGASNAALTFTECELLGAPDCEVTVAPATTTSKVPGLFYPVGAAFTTMTVGGEFCPLEFDGESITGAVGINVPAETARPLIEEYPKGGLVFLSFQSAELTGAVELELDGANAGEPWTAD